MSVTIKGLEEVTKKLESLGKPSAFKRPMTQSVAHLQGKLANPPPKAKGAFSDLATPGQKRAYWARVGSGEIEHREGIGYRRTGNTARAWTTKVSPDGRKGEVGNIEPGAPYVYGAPDQRPWAQQPFHARSGWSRVDKVIKEEQATIVKFFQKQYEKLLSK